MSTAVIIGFRDRGTDPLRAANLTRTLEHWSSFGTEIIVVSDGLTGDAQFNRHKAYNRGAAQTDAEILAFVESDMLLPFGAMDTAIDWAADAPGLVVPFTERHEFGPPESELIRDHRALPQALTANVVKLKPRRTGAINVLSRRTLQLVGGYDEAFAGSWWDDRAMHLAFDVCAGPTRWVDGPSFHLYHQPGYEGQHLTAADKAATRANLRRFIRYQRVRTPEQIRILTAGG
ncbi:glycosyltransferase family 2 protein [Mycolicibacterium sp. A43C]